MDPELAGKFGYNRFSFASCNIRMPPICYE